MDTCFFCGKATLGLIGQDEILDTCILQPGDAALQANAYGDCHVRCLSESEWGFHWHQCVRRWYQGHQSIRELDLANGLIAFVNSANGTTEILKVNGMHWTFRSAWVASLSRLDDQIYLLPRATDYTFSFGDRIELASAVQSELTLSTTYSLLSLASSLNLETVTMYSETLALGELRYVEKLRSYWTENSISCRARYFEVIPREVFEAYEFVQSDGVL